MDNLEDSELENYLADIEDVVSGRTVDMDHAKVMYTIVDALGELANSIDWVENNDQAFRDAVNSRSIDELNQMIDEINRMREQIDSYFGADEEDEEPDD